MPHGPLEALKKASGIGAPTPKEKLKQTWDTYGGMMGAATPFSGGMLRELGMRGSARDLLGNPRAMETMEAMFKENNPIFRKMQQTGMFSNRPMTSTPPIAAPKPVPFERLDVPNPDVEWRGLAKLKSLFGY